MNDKDTKNKNIIMNVIDEVKPLVESKLDVKFVVTLVERHVCIAQPAFYRMIIGIKLVESVCKNHGYDVTTAILLLMTHEALHIKGMKHDAKSRKLGFYSDTLRDTYTPKIVSEMLSMDT